MRIAKARGFSTVPLALTVEPVRLPLATTSHPGSGFEPPQPVKRISGDATASAHTARRAAFARRSTGARSCASAFASTSQLPSDDDEPPQPVTSRASQQTTTGAASLPKARPMIIDRTLRALRERNFRADDLVLRDE